MNILSQVLEFTARGKQDNFQNVTAHWQGTGHPRAHMETEKRQGCFHVTHVRSLLCPIDYR